MLVMNVDIEAIHKHWKQNFKFLAFNRVHILDMCMWTPFSIALIDFHWIVQNGYKYFSGICYLIFFCKVHDYTYQCCGHRRQGHSQVSDVQWRARVFFPTSIQNTYSLEGAFSCKRLYISFCIFALLLYYRKVLS